MIVPIRLFWHFLIALTVMSSLNFNLTIPFNAVLQLHYSVFVVIRRSSTKHRIRTAALINFFDPNAALIRGRCLIEGGALSMRVNTVCAMCDWNK